MLKVLKLQLSAMNVMLEHPRADPIFREKGVSATQFKKIFQRLLELQAVDPAELPSTSQSTPSSFGGGANDRLSVPFTPMRTYGYGHLMRGSNETQDDTAVEEE